MSFPSIKDIFHKIYFVDILKAPHNFPMHLIIYKKRPLPLLDIVPILIPFFLSLHDSMELVTSGIQNLV